MKKNAITGLQLQYDTLKANGFTSSFPIHLLATRQNGKQATTPGFKNGTLSWNQFIILVENGTFREGAIHYDWKKVYHTGHQITVHISPKNNPGLKVTYHISIPYLTSISFQPYGNHALMPGYKYRFEIEGIYSNGKVYSTSKTSTGYRLLPEHFKLDYLQYSPSHTSFFLPARLQPYPKNVKITGTYLIDTTMSAQIEVPIEYIAHYTFNFAADKASSGRSGTDASGCNRRNGRDGQDGQQGQRGQRGKTVKLYAQSLVVSSDTLIKLKAIAGTQSQEVLLHPGGSLSIDCRGGEGGDGGSGGDGSDGRDETEKEPAGYGGNGGNGGDGGDGGEGGRVIIYTDSVTLAFIEKMIIIKNSGGNGGQGGSGGKRGRGGTQTKDTSFLTALGNLLGANSGSSGSNGYSGQEGENGSDTETVILSAGKLSDYF